MIMCMINMLNSNEKTAMVYSVDCGFAGGVLGRGVAVSFASLLSLNMFMFI
jgi:hypothetical protein